jgi:hypothetical protein
MKIAFQCIAHGHEGHWEALCLDLDLSVQGRTYAEVTASLEQAIKSYVHDALEMNEPKLLYRRSPWHVRAGWALKLLWATLCGQRMDNDKSREETIGFPVSCPA